MALLGVLGPRLALAHSGEPLAPHDMWTASRWDPATVFLLALSSLLYALGTARSRGISARRRLYFWTGTATLAIALVSPLHAVGESLFSAHMAQHEILMLIGAPLLALSQPLVSYLWGLPLPARRYLGRLLIANPHSPGV